MSLATPEKIRTLQRKLYYKAKQEPAFRFFQLYDKMYRKDILNHSYRLSRQAGGSPGVDGITFEDIEEQGKDEWLALIGKELHAKTYMPDSVRRVMIPKPNGGERPLGIPTIKDRIVQTAAKLILEPIFEADLEDCAYGYRRGRSARDATKAIHRAIIQGYREVVDADLAKYFDTIPHHYLMKSVARRVCDRHMLRIIKSWLKVPVEEQYGNGSSRKRGGKRTKQGVPQGGVMTPRTQKATSSF